MNKNFSLLAVLHLLATASAFAQVKADSTAEISVEQLDVQISHFLKKSNHQKTTGWILAGGGIGVAAVVSSTINKYHGSNPKNGSDLVVALGGLVSASSILVFFEASKNRNNAALIDFRKAMLLASNDSARQISLLEAENYFSTKARSNTRTATILSIIGGVGIIGGLVVLNENPSNSFIAGTPVILLEGVGIGLLSIPFHIRGSQLKKTTRSIMTTGQIPMPRGISISPTIHAGKYLALGIRISI